MGVLIIITDDTRPEQPSKEDVDAYESLWDAARTADYLNTDEDTVYELARTGKLPSVRLSEKRVRFNPPVIRQWVSNGGKLDDGLRLVKG